MLENQMLINRNLITLMKDMNKSREASEKIRILALPEFDINTADDSGDYVVEEAEAAT
jgi:hypothetical protein